MKHTVAKAERDQLVYFLFSGVKVPIAICLKNTHTFKNM